MYMHAAGSIRLKTRVQTALEQDFWHEWLQLGTLFESNGAGSEDFGAQPTGNQADAFELASRPFVSRGSTSGGGGKPDRSFRLLHPGKKEKLMAACRKSASATAGSARRAWGRA